MLKKPYREQYHKTINKRFLYYLLILSAFYLEPAQKDTKYLIWHRTTSSRSSSSRNPLGLNAKDDSDDQAGNLFDNFCMISGSHASTLDRLYAWERKLYDEVKVLWFLKENIVLILPPFMCFALFSYDSKCGLLVLPTSHETRKLHEDLL